MVWNTVAAVGGQIGMSLLSKLFGGGGTSNASTRLNRKDTKWMYDEQSSQWRANTEWYNQNGYSMLREGLENAGYNPLMALGASPVQGATVEGSAMESNERSANFDIKQAIGMTAAMIKNTNADTMLKKAQTEENISRSNLEIAQKIATDEHLPLDLKIKAFNVIGAELQNQLTESEIGLNNAEANFKQQSVKESEARTRLTDKQVEELNYQIKLLRNEKIISDKQANYLLAHPTEAERLLRAGMYTGVIGNIFGGNAGVNYSVKKK